MLAITIRFALYANLMVLFGWPLFALYGTRDKARGLSPRSLASLILLAVFLSVAGMLAMTASMSGVAIIDVDRGSTKAMVFETPMGVAWQVRMAALAAIAVLAFVRNPAARVAQVAVAGAALASLAWTGHGAAGEATKGLVKLVADIVHLLAAGAWIGALVALGLMVARNASRLKSADFISMHCTLDGFSKAGTVFVALLIVTGSVNTWILVGPAGIGLIGSDQYVQLLALKLALFAAMVGLAAINRFRLTPAFSRDLDAGVVPLEAHRALRRSIAIEAGLAASVLAIVAWLGTLVPPASL
ncbi:copper resistance protein CopD [Polymorphobacter glacialis]|uniref:Copper resistance protein CopD n=1 Tax=Sandarakinorhabdus glacialis TaxID=1614636 RepID=A0A916ZT12_9SPHN|nr:copper homeostasis membrane protein CopD [Polymorphobacter glacialis]GGE12774.1 copper resistance protein CopD [Polymorphobacter glacialis]